VWGLPLARSIAEQITEDRHAIRALVRELFGDDVEVRKRAADVARRITERDGRMLEPYADELAGLLETLPLEESRTRWHLGMVVPRVAHTREQRLRVARTMSLLAEDASNVVRCSAVEGLGWLAVQEASLRDEAEEMIERFLREGTTAMKCRARHAQRKLERPLPLLDLVMSSATRVRYSWPHDGSVLAWYCSVLLCFGEGRSGLASA
jgi:hypothetical protein